MPWGKKVKYQMAVTSEVNQMRGEIPQFNYDFIEKGKRMQGKVAIRIITLLLVYINIHFGRGS